MGGGDKGRREEKGKRDGKEKKAGWREKDEDVGERVKIRGKRKKKIDREREKSVQIWTTLPGWQSEKSTQFLCQMQSFGAITAPKAQTKKMKIKKRCLFEM